MRFFLVNVLGFALALIAGNAAAAARVLVVVDAVQSSTSTMLVSRFREELIAEGFEVVALQEHELLEPTPALATIRVRDRLDGVSIHVRLERSAPAADSERWFHSDARDARTIVLRAVEYVRASRIEIERATRRPRPAPAKEAKPERPHPPLDYRWKAELGAVLFVGTVGERAALGPAVVVGYRLPGERFWLELRLASLAMNSVEDARGSARLTHSLGTLAARWNFLGGPALGLLATASGGAYVLTATGDTNPALTASTDHEATLAATAGAGVFTRLSSLAELTLLARSELLFTAPRPGVRFGSGVVDRMARPSLLLSLGAEAHF